MTIVTAEGASQQVLAAANRLSPELDRRAREGEQRGTMPSDLVESMRAEGIFRIIQPRGFGGLELAPADVIEVIAALSHADGSAGWTALIGTGGPAFAAWLDPAVAVELFGHDADATIATVFAPSGRATPSVVPGRFDVSGRWPFASGSRHAEWFLAGVMVCDDNGPRMLPGHGPDWRLAYFPRARGEVLGEWDVMGLRGTGSNDIAAADVPVAEEHMIRPFTEAARHDGPLWRLPFFTLVGVALVGFPLGVGQRALDEFAELAPGKTRAGSPQPLAGDPAVQVQFAGAEAGLRAARAYVLDTVGAFWDTACAGDVPTVQQRANFQLAAQQAMKAATVAVDVALAAVGAGAIRSDHPLQRCFRDLHTAAQHVYFSPEALKRYAKVRLGIEQPLVHL